jgi:homoserine kinase
MAVKTVFSQAGLQRILAAYDLGRFVRSEALQRGTVQTNYILHTTQGRYVLRYYENRSEESVRFEIDLLTYLAARQYPCPAVYANKQGAYLGTHHDKPYAIFQFIEGQHVEDPNLRQRSQVVQRAAELQALTVDFRSPYTPHRWNYNPDLCRTLAHAEARKLDTQRARDKYAWLTHELSALYLPPSAPKGICHCDYHYTNLLFRGDEFVALIDFDDANRTYTQFDLVCLIEYWAWPRAERIDLERARRIAQAYAKHRPMSAIEQECMYDVYKLSILFDCVWYFDRGTVEGCLERRKIDGLTAIGRERFRDALFGDP